MNEQTSQKVIDVKAEVKDTPAKQDKIEQKDLAVYKEIFDLTVSLCSYFPKTALSTGLALMLYNCTPLVLHSSITLPANYHPRPKTTIENRTVKSELEAIAQKEGIKFSDLCKKVDVQRPYGKISGKEFDNYLAKQK